MPDVFLSYSRKDSSEALDLACRLRQLGIDVWIDQEGINVATIWSAEIAKRVCSDSASERDLHNGHHDRLDLIRLHFREKRWEGLCNAIF